MKNKMNIVVVSAIVGAVISGLIFYALQSVSKSEAELIEEFYKTETAVAVSPHHLRKNMTKGKTDDYVLIDLRSQEEYEKEHIATAVNIPSYKDPSTSAYDEKDRIINSFREVVKNNPGKDIITYCYSMPCMTSRKIGKMLAENNIYVKHLNIGWNEWRYYWDLWNHDSEVPTQVEDYIAVGKEPGLPKTEGFPSSCGAGEFSC